MSGTVRAEQAVTEARRAVHELLVGLPAPVADEARASLDALIEAAREVECQIYLNQPTLKTCCVPGCFKQFDALNGGRVRPEWGVAGWKALRLSAADYICPVHAPLLDEHMPQWAQRERDRSVLRCACGWASPEAYWHGYAVAAWRDHLAQAAALIDPDTQEQP